VATNVQDQGNVARQEINLTMTNGSSAARSELVRQLRELVAALDQRVPHVERSGEAAIARDAAALREKALRRIAALEDPGTEADNAAR
jgi:hypothetical protein